MAYVLVIGASGGIGRATLSAALDAGHRVRAFSRSAHTLHLDHDRLEKCRGDAKKAADAMDKFEYIAGGGGDGEGSFEFNLGIGE